MNSTNLGLVSICVPTYNRPNLIVYLIDSILRQSYSNFEVIITDNSDNYDTSRLFQVSYTDSRLKYFHNGLNLGMGGNTRRALSLLRGQFFTFTPDDDVWIDTNRLEKLVKLMHANPDINIFYTNAISIAYDGSRLSDFGSVYRTDSNQSFEILQSCELLPGFKTKYFLNILTPLMRASALLDLFRQSWFFESEEFFCYYLSASGQNIGFLYDKTVALRETDHHRTSIEDGQVVDWKVRKDIRIRQIIAIYTSLTYLYPETKKLLETSHVHNFLGRHLLLSAKVSRSLPLLFSTLGACFLHLRYFNLFKSLRVRPDDRKSFG